MSKKYLVLIFLLVTAFKAFSQGELSLYQLNESLPQANNLNASFQPEHRVVIGFPVISSFRLFVDNDGLSFNDYFQYNDNHELYLDTLGLPGKVKRMQRFAINNTLGLFYFGLRGKRSYFSFSINEVTDFKLNYPGNLIRWAIQGPADSRLQDSDLPLDAFGLKALSYYEASVGYSRAINNKLKVGLKLKYLQGLGTVDTKKISGAVHIGADSVSIASGDILINTGGIALSDEDDPDIVSYMLSNGNRGAALDLGASYQLNNRIGLSAAVNDIGFIKWSDYTRSYEIDPAQYSYSGFDLLDLVNKDANDEFLQAEQDSIENLYDPREVDGTKFSTPLRPKTYLGATYALGKKHKVGALVYFDFFKGDINPSLALSYNLKLGRILNMVVNTAFVNGTFTGLGAGFTLKLGGMQVYATSDQVMSAVYPSRASIAELHTGINLVFGKVKSDKIKEEEQDDEPKEEMTEEEFLDKLEDETVKADTVVVENEVDTTTFEPDIPSIQPDTTSQVEEPVSYEKDTVAADTLTIPAALVKPEEVEEEPLTEVYDSANDRTIIKKGTHPDELAPGNYVIVGVFSIKTNAQRYNQQLRDAEYKSDFGYISKRGAYYVYAKKSESLQEVRNVRDLYRKIDKFQFSNAWVLTIEE